MREYVFHAEIYTRRVYTNVFHDLICIVCRDSFVRYLVESTVTATAKSNTSSVNMSTLHVLQHRHHIGIADNAHLVAVRQVFVYRYISIYTYTYVYVYVYINDQINTYIHAYVCVNINF